METKNSATHYFDLLYEYMKGRCENSSHTGVAIYFCINENCSSRYVCSECIIDNHDHLASHNKFFVPLDNRTKFLKYADLLELEAKSLITKKSNNNSKKSEEEDKIVQQLKSFSIDLKDFIVSVIDEHMKTHMDEYLSKFTKPKNQICGDQESKFDKLIQQVTEEINNFINLKNKVAFAEFHERLNKIITSGEESLKRLEAVQDSRIKILENININKEMIRNKINSLIEENISFCAGFEISSKEEQKNIISQNEEKSKTFTFGSYIPSEENNNSIPNPNTLMENTTTTTNITIEETNNNSLTKANLDNFVNSLGYDSLASEETQIRSSNIKNRLEDLKNRLSTIKK